MRSTALVRLYWQNTRERSYERRDYMVRSRFYAEREQIQNNSAVMINLVRTAAPVSQTA